VITRLRQELAATTDSWRRVRIAEIVGYVDPGAPDIAPLLVKELSTSANPSRARIWAAKTLGIRRLRFEPAIPALTAVLKDPDLALRTVAATSLWYLEGDRPDLWPTFLEVLRAADDKAAGVACSCLEQIGKPAVEHLAPALRQENAKVAKLRLVRILQALRTQAHEEGSAAIRRVLFQDADAEVRLAAVNALAVVAQPDPELQAEACLYALRHDRDPQVRLRAAEVIAATGKGGKRALPFLKDLAEKADGDLAVALRHAIGEIESAR
jgi:HEAT repeat protein